MRSGQRLSEFGPVELAAFEDWDRTVQASAGPWKKVASGYVSVGRDISMHRAAGQMLADAKTGKVIFDPKRRQLGLVPTQGVQRNSYRMGGYSLSPQISARRSFEYYGLTITECIRWTDLQVIDSVLVVGTVGGEHA